MTNVFAKIRRWRDKAASHGRLARLDPRLLDDIGIARCEIGRVVRGLR